MILPRGMVYAVNDNGPTVEPCGRPYNMTCSVERAFPILTRDVLLVKYDLSHWRAVPLKPISFSILFRRIPWSTVSNAQLRSSNTRKTPFNTLSICALYLLIRAGSLGVTFQFYPCSCHGCTMILFRIPSREIFADISYISFIYIYRWRGHSAQFSHHQPTSWSRPH